MFTESSKDNKQSETDDNEEKIKPESEQEEKEVGEPKTENSNKTEQQSQDSQEEPKKKRKRNEFVVRLPPELLDALDKASGEGKRSALVNKLLKEGIEKTGGTIDEAFDYKELVDKKTECIKKMDAVKRAMGRKFGPAHELALFYGDNSLDPEKIPSIIARMIKFQPDEKKHHFTKSNISDFIPYLEAKLLYDEIEKKLNPARAKKYSTVVTNAIQKDDKDFISKIRESKELREDDNRRCFYDLDTGYAFASKKALKAGGIHWGNETRNTPEKLLTLIKKSGHWVHTNAEEKEWLTEYLKEHGTKTEKAQFNIYLFYRLFPIAFPEEETRFLGELVTDDLTNEKARVRLIDREARDLCITQRNRHANDTFYDPEYLIDCITSVKDGWCLIDRKGKEILDAYLQEHNLPFPKYQGKHVPLEFAIFNDEDEAFAITREGKCILENEGTVCLEAKRKYAKIQKELKIPICGAQTSSDSEENEEDEN